MNQSENKTKANKNGNGNGNGNGGEHTGVELSADNQAADQPQASRAAGDRDQSQPDPQFSLRSLRAEAEIYAISRTLEYTGWNRRRAAQLLSISYRGILYKIRQHNLTPSSGRVVPSLDETLKVD
jgi:DNA-binding NtrC family response regulator